MTESWYLAFFALNIVFCFRLKSKDGFFVQITIYLYNKPNHNVSMNISQNSFLMNGCCFHKSFPSSDQIPETPPEASEDFFFNIHRSLIKCLRKKQKKTEKEEASGWTEVFKKCIFFRICVLFSFDPFGMTSDFWTLSVTQVLSRGCNLCVHPQFLSLWHSNPSPESQLARSSTCGS